MKLFRFSSVSCLVLLLGVGAAAAIGCSDSDENGSSNAGGGGVGAKGENKGNAGGGDAGTDDPIDPNVDPKEQGLVPMFVATGHMGRSVISCDDGKTWIADRAFDTDGDAVTCGVPYPTRCNTKGYDCPVMKGKDGDFACTMDDAELAADPESDAQCDCTHHPGSSQGMAYGNGVWVSAWGWGGVPTVRRTGNGVSWEVVLDGLAADPPFDVKTYTEVGFGNGTFMVGSRQSARSSDDGKTWEQTGSADLKDQVVWPSQPAGPSDKDTGAQTVHNARTFGFADVGDGLWVLTGSSKKSRTHDMSCADAEAAGFCDLPEGKCEDVDGQCKESSPTKDIMVSTDDGDTWVRPDPLPRACGNGDILGGNGVAVIAMGGRVCFSTDEGASFEVADLPAEKSGTMVFDGEQFVAFSSDGMMTSSDAKTWSGPVAYTDKPQDFRLGPVAYNPETGVFVSIKNSWGSWYGEDSVAYRSEDGLSWTEISGDAYPKSHSIQDIAFGYGKPAEGGCPPLEK